MAAEIVKFKKKLQNHLPLRQVGFLQQQGADLKTCLAVSPL
jgi:hypothetical protein